MGDTNQETVNVLMQVVQMLQSSGRPGIGHNTQASIQDQPSTSGQNAQASEHGQSSNAVSNASQPASASIRIPSVARVASAPNHSHQSTIEEHRRLFTRQSRVQPYSGRLTSFRRRRAPARKEKSLTRTMFCFADKAATEAPSCSEKLALHQNGIGEKRISFPVSASDAAVKDLLYESYPQLRQTGGFQLLVSQEKARKQLKVVSHGSCSTEQIRCFGSGRIYIRPLQRSIPLTEGVKLHEEVEVCLTCEASVAVSEMHQHQEFCEGYKSSDEELPLGISERTEELDNIPTIIDGDQQRSGNDTVAHIYLNDHAADTPIVAMQTAHVPDGAVSEIIADGNGPDSTNAEPPIGDVANSAEIENRPDLRTSSYIYEEHLRKAIDATLTGTNEDDEPVHVLRTFVCHFMRGRELDVQDAAQVLEGETAEIFVSRANLFEDGIDELIGGMGHDPSLPLEVTFNGECAQDLGGPRKEFLCAMVREIKDRLFLDTGDSTYVLRDDVVAEDRRHYFCAGLVFGYSMLQGGPLPCFMHENLMSRLIDGLDGEELISAEEQLRDGFSRFGLVELIKKRSSLLFLLRRTARHPLTYPRMVKLFTPRFSEQGSNSRLKEERTYRLFLNYIKEVAAGRREPISLSSILKFATCSEDEPVLGFAIQPAVCFSDSTQSCLPTCNTCINQLVLATGEVVPENKEEMFTKFDLAFSNDHFGLV